MKKLLLLAAALVFAVACSQMKPTPDLKPEPVGDPTINLTRIAGKKAISDTVHVIIGNYSGDVEFSSEDPNFYLELDSKTKPGIIILNSLTFGSTDIYVKCDTTTFTIPSKFDQLVTEHFYSKPLMPFGKSVDEIIALEVARGNNGTPVRGFTTDRKFYTVAIPVKLKNEYTTSEVFSYVFPVTDETEIGTCNQSTILSQYGKDENAKNCSAMAWGETTETHYYCGVDSKYGIEYAIDRDLQFVTLYQAGNDPSTGIYSYQGHYIPYVPASGVSSKVAENAQIELFSVCEMTPIADIRKSF